MIFKLFSSKNKLGIDIGTASIKAIELSCNGGRFKLENYGVFEFKGSTTENIDSQNLLKLPDSEIIWGLKELLKKSSMKSKNVVASIPSFSTFSTVIEMPYLSEEDLARAIPFEAKKYVPIPLDEVILDWSIVGVVGSEGDVITQKKDGEGKAPTVEIFIAAVSKDETARYQRIMQGTGLNLVALELENAGLVRSLLGNDLSPAAIINIGGRSTSIVIVDQGYERLGHNYEVGGFEITKAISSSLNITLEKAEDMKRKFGLSEGDDNPIKDSVVSLVDMMVFESKKIISNYEDMKNRRIHRVILVGGLVSAPNFVNYFRQRMEREVFAANVFARISHPQRLTPIIPELSNSFAIAAGLAMRDN